MPAVSLREADVRDHADIRRAVVILHEAERALSDTRRHGDESADAYMDWLAERGSFRGACLVAEIAGVFAGFVAGWMEEEEMVEETPDSRRYGYISDICVLPEFRGLGVAQDMLAAIERRLAQAGARRVRLCVLADNHVARSAYARAGFAPHEVIYEKWVGGDLRPR
jgi:ribosomal protein S18 acetylase RimI-like enzyme